MVIRWYTGDGQKEQNRGQEKIFGQKKIFGGLAGSGCDGEEGANKAAWRRQFSTINGTGQKKEIVSIYQSRRIVLKVPKVLMFQYLIPSERVQ